MATTQLPPSHLGGPAVGTIDTAMPQGRLPYGRRKDDIPGLTEAPQTRDDVKALEAHAATQRRGTNPKDALGSAKPSISCVPPAALIYLSLAMGDGKKKYGPYNWRENAVIASIYIDACFRHLLAWYDGEEVASDSQRPHLAHALASLAIIVDALETGNLIDDRPIKGAAPALIERYTVKK